MILLTFMHVLYMISIINPLGRHQMINENQQNHSTDVQEINSEFIRTVTAAVLQTLQTTGQLSGESKDSKSSRDFQP